MRPEHRFTFSSNLIIYGDNMNKISDVKKVILSKLWVLYSTKNASDFSNFLTVEYSIYTTIVKVERMKPGLET